MQPKKRIEHMQRRREQGMTHKELADEYGMSRQHVGRLLAGQFSHAKNFIKNPLPHEYDDKINEA